MRRSSRTQLMGDPHFKKLLLRLNMARYSALREHSGIDWTELSGLSEPDLEQLGVSPECRKELMQAVREALCAPEGSSRGLSDTTLVPLAQPVQNHEIRNRSRNSPDSYIGEAPGERRQITVMFCDIAGSTKLSRCLDPEDLREVVHSYQRCCAEIVDRYEGHIAQYLGDGILSYFGYPQTRENDAERAVRAGLAVVGSLGALNTRILDEKQVEIAVRIGIATGLVVVGDTFHSGDVDDAKAFGVTPNLAARLQAVAPPNTIAVAKTTYDLLESRFDFVSLGAHSLPGLTEPCPIWRVVRPADAEKRFESTQHGRTTPIVGRDRELAQIADRWRATLQSDGQVVVVSGESGIGKSRLVSAFEAELDGVRHDRKRLFCSPFFDNSPLHPIIEYLERMAGFAAEDDPAERRAKVTALLEENDLCLDAVLPLFLDLLGVSTCDAGASTDVTSHKRREMLLRAIMELLLDRAEPTPRIIVFEDIQWIDPTTNELLHRIVESLPGRSAMLIATYRPEFRPAWIDEPHVSLVALGRLGRRPTEELIKSIAGRSTKSSNFVAQIVERADGVPLFVEELTKTFLDREIPASTNGKEHDPGVKQGLIPATLHASLTARLDQLPLCKEIAQIGSVIGRQFSEELIVSVTKLPVSVVKDALSLLVENGILYCRGQAPITTLAFKHALLQEAAYQSLLLRQRRRLHQRIARSLESGVDGPFPSPEILAHHYSEAGDIDRAVANWARAAQTASAHSAYREAINCLEKGLSLLSSIRVAHRDPGVEERELELLLALGAALIALTGVGSSEVAAVYARALALCADLPESRLHFTANWNWWRVSMDLRTGRHRADALLALAQRLADPELIMQAHHALWATSFNLGDQRGCLEHIECGLRLYVEARKKPCSSVYGGHDAHVCGEGEAALSLWLLGFPSRAATRAATALETARKLGQASSVAHALDIAITLCKYRRDADGVSTLSKELLDLAEKIGFPDYAAKAGFFLGWSRSVSGEVEAGLSAMLSAMSNLRSVGTREDFPIYLEMIADIFGGLGRKREALHHLDEALKLSETYGIGYWTAEIYRRKGLVLLGDDPGHSDVDNVREGRACLFTALETARAQDVRMLELRAARSLAHLYLQEGRIDDARSLLVPVFNRFDEGKEERDLQEVTALVLKLGQVPSINSSSRP